MEKFVIMEANSVNNSTLPPNMTFTNRSMTVIIVYCIFFIIAAIGNLTVFITLSRGRYKKSRIALMICHLSAADLFVTFFMIPLEVGWRVTVKWLAGNFACKICLFLRAFGLYLSSNILICVSLDRYFAVLHPLKLNDAKRRGKLMLTVAWIASVIYAIPQSFIFHVATHPEYPNFTQCVTFGFFKSESQENIYNIFCLLAMYFVPLIVICWVYMKIFCEINSKSRENRQVLTRTRSDGSSGSLNSGSDSRMRLRCSDMSRIKRARTRALRMTITIVAVFILCWTPYVTMVLWYIIDRQSALNVKQEIQEALFIMAVGNSCANPLVYGSYAVDLKKECCRCFLPFPKEDNIQTYYVQRDTRPKSLIVEKQSPGESVIFIKSVRRILHDYFKVGRGQTETTCNTTLNAECVMIKNVV
ncbi:gonadotropin-releasing hormone II receptor-like [Leptopilina heterotoma]|uniref:gonadotropin-releasing hormone II receptor-like n=1 Tax=Leptopilina heterotoma TaxID=63436 RepID=UPI001CA8D05A|nr:gonadotropin-releasing hormone II receptor-like [Leptopilina heterotoma]XP_043474124.1 gonadotropin-releasing hormone II receptor-like [Leptopilina heterotoma]